MDQSLSFSDILDGKQDQPTLIEFLYQTAGIEKHGSRTNVFKIMLNQKVIKAVAIW